MTTGFSVWLSFVLSQVRLVSTLITHSGKLDMHI